MSGISLPPIAGAVPTVFSSVPSGIMSRPSSGSSDIGSTASTFLPQMFNGENIFDIIYTFFSVF